MQLCIDATRFGFGLEEAIDLAASRKVGALEFSFEPFPVTGKAAALSAQEKGYLGGVKEKCAALNVKIAVIRLGSAVDLSDKKAAKQFTPMIQKLAYVARSVDCRRLAIAVVPGSDDGWVELAEETLAPLSEMIAGQEIRLLLSTSTPAKHLGKSLRSWRPLYPKEWRDLVSGCPGMGLSFSAADCMWQNIDYLQILSGLVPAIDHVEANDVEINRSMLADSGLFGPLWWRYRRPGKGQIDWKQLIEALKLYDYSGTFSIHLDDEFIGEDESDLQDALDTSIGMLAPLLKY